MKLGLNNFYVYATDISGNAFTGATSGSWAMYGEIEGNPFTVFDSVTEITGNAGFYNFEVELSNSGQGFLQITNSNPLLNIAPTYFDLDVTVHDVEDVYGQVANTIYDGVTKTLQFYEQINIEAIKEGDDVQFDVVVDTSIASTLSGWTDFKMTLREAGSVSSSGAEFIIGDATIEGVNTTTNTVSIRLPYTLTAGIVPEGEQNTIVYGDLQARNPAGYRKTLAELQATVVRQFTEG